MFKNKLFSLFNKSQKKKLILLVFFMFIASLSEMIGLGLIFPIVGLFLGITNNWFVIKLTSFFDVSSTQLLPYALSLFLIFYLAKIFFLIFYAWYENNFLQSYTNKIFPRIFLHFFQIRYSYYFEKK